MNIGDRVRILRGKEEGIITRILDSKLVEIEIEDGFQIPVLIKDLAIVAKEESAHFESPAGPGKTEPKPIQKTNKGIYLAFSEINDRQLSLHLINNYDWQLLFTVGQQEEQGYRGIISGTLEPSTAQKLKDLEIKHFEKWPPLIIQMLFHKMDFSTLKDPFVKHIKFKASSFFKKKQFTPVLNKASYLIRIDEEIKRTDVEKLKEKILESSEGQAHAIPFRNRPEKIIDLHIEKLTKNYAEMSNRQMLEMQLQVFDQKLDNAIASGMDEITFIHGLGNGTLKNEIHKKLSKEKNILYFEDAMKEKFGYGATLVKIN